MSDEGNVIVDLERLEVIDLVEDERAPRVLDVVRSSAVRRAAARALHDLESHHGHGPWLVVCTETVEVLASSPSFDAETGHGWREHLEGATRCDNDEVPLAVVSFDGNARGDDAAMVAAQLVADALGEIVAAEHRAAEATARAGRAEALAATDALTGLGNQRAWWDRIAEEDARIMRSEASAVVAVIDLDGLKAVNDERGHLHGDLLLRLAAQTIRHAVRSCDVVARVGGDEFAVLAVDFDGEPAVLTGRITKALEVAGIDASVGAAAPSAGASLVDAYARADQEMYADKRARLPHLPTSR